MILCTWDNGCWLTWRIMWDHVMISNPPQHTCTWSSFQAMWPWRLISFTEVCQKSHCWRRLEYFSRPETASTAASFEEAERNQKRLCPGNTGYGWPAECYLPLDSPEWRRWCRHLPWRVGAVAHRCQCLDDVRSKCQRPCAGRHWCDIWCWLPSSRAVEQRSHDWIWWKRL